MVRASTGGEGESTDETRGLISQEDELEDELNLDSAKPSLGGPSPEENGASTSTGSSGLSTSIVPDVNDPGGGKIPESIVEDEEEKNQPKIGYFSLYRYASCCEKFILCIGILMAASTGLVPAWANIAFGQFTKAMVQKGSNVQCPPLASNGTSPFMKAVEDFAIRQCSLGVFVLLFGYIFVTCFNSVAENQVHKIRKIYFEKLLRQDIGWFDKNAKRDFSSRLVEDMLKIQDAVSEKVGMLVACISNCIFLIGISFYYGWKLTSALMVLFPALGLITTFNSNVSSGMSAKEQLAYSEAGAVAEEVLTNIKTVNAFNGQDREAKRYDTQVLKAKKVAIQKHILVGLGNGLNWGISYVNFSFAFWYGTHLVLKSREAGDGLYGVDNILVIFFSILMSGYYIGDSSQYFQAMAEGKGAARGIFHILNRESRIDSLSSTGEIPRNRAVGEIEFENVKFSYPTRPSVEILRKLNLVIRPGQTVALVGSSGCGKSTCVALLQRFYDPIDGRVKIDGVDLKDLNISWLRSQCGLVGQEPVLFNATISENIAFGLDNISHEDIVKAAKIAFAHEFISQLPLGYDTPAGERGAQLSGGQKQRIAIARALIRNPPILLLDEATSALDFQSEAIVQAALERAREGRTTIIVAHRLSTIKAADVVVAIDKGEVKESGTHEELMKLQGLYYKLVMSQEDKEELVINPEELLEEERELRDTLSQDIFEGQSNETRSRSALNIRSRTRLISEVSLDDTASLIHESVEVVEPAIKKGSLWRLWKMNFKEWPYILVMVICTMLKALQLPVYAYIFGRYIAIFTIKDDFEVLAKGNFYAMIYMIIAILITVDGFLQYVFVGIAGESFTYRIRNIVFSSMLKQDMTFYDESENTVGKLCARLSTDATSLRGVTSGRLTGLIQASTIVIAAGAMSFFLIPKMSAVTMVFVPAMIYIAFMEGRVLGSDNVVEKEAIEKSCNLAVEALNNVRTVASLCAEKKFMQFYDKALADSHRINKRRSHIRGLVYGLVSSGAYFCYSLSLLYGGYLIEHECVSIADVFTVAEALIFCTTSGGAAMAFAPDYDKGKIAATRILELLDRVPLLSRLSSNLTVAQPEGKLEFEKVTFYYRNRPSVRVLKNVDLIAKTGGNVALVGPSGSGKSTCAALILRFYDPTSGEVRFDDTDLKTINLDHLRQQLSIVSQEPILFDCTIADNIAYGDTTREVPMDEIITAARMANIHDFITSLPAGYETRVGSLGSQLSGGQKQRVAISRALVKNPKILILDEATSALDTESEAVVQAALDVAGTGRTCITIAHRLTSIQNSDQIIVMKNGSIREIGTHTELLNKDGGLYRDMWLAQKLQRDDT